MQTVLAKGHAGLRVWSRALSKLLHKSPRVFFTGSEQRNKTPDPGISCANESFWKLASSLAPPRSRHPELAKERIPPTPPFHSFHSGGRYCRLVAQFRSIPSQLWFPSLEWQGRQLKNKKVSFRRSSSASGTLRAKKHRAMLSSGVI